MRLCYERGIGHIDNIRHGSYDVTKFGTSLGEGVGDDAQNRPCLDICVVLHLG